MKIDVGEIVDHPGTSVVFNQDEQLELAELKLLAPVRVALKALSLGEGRISLVGTISTQAELECSRCANNYAEPLEVEVDELFLPKGSPELEPSSSKEDVEAASLCVFAYECGQLELDEVLRQNILASLPFCPLCKEDCKGVCAGCGVDLNTGVCTCSTEKEIDPRWNALKKFMQ